MQCLFGFGISMCTSKGINDKARFICAYKNFELPYLPVCMLLFIWSAYILFTVFFFGELLFTVYILP